MPNSKLKIIECPRDAMQGLHDYIPADVKAKYINQLLKVGFDTIDFGSFVSPKAIPQMKDTAEVLSKLDLNNTSSKLLAIVANQRGAHDAVQFEEINYLGYPFSISETFQMRNTNATIAESLDRVQAIQELCVKHNKKMVVYLSMGFGNPYGDTWSAEVCAQWVERLYEMGITIMALSDTIGIANEESIKYLFSKLIPLYPKVEIGAHFHTTPTTWKEKIDAAYKAGCRRFDGAIKGFGGCPMAKDDLTGNMPTENLIRYFLENEIEDGIDQMEFISAMSLANEVFPR
jgi:hydroxymethylglutaryl-CoA lyase